ncbi:AAA family ATPase [Echinicola rosea]|uniref:AAA domain-containing protein n=1 Tax=Echinicola rosea TaxID=1807691 RepID=A0ABQ1UT22_9BACT|nr:AAA family ATPase [Echinicola rosea]GGF24561.1 hypothetical protein GCM10011339_10870 [Echinicola rosea]
MEKTIIITGPRQVGKTTLPKDILSGISHLFLNRYNPTLGNLVDRHKLFSNRFYEHLEKYYWDDE